MSKVKVGVVGYGTIGMRLADGVAKQEDMELVGVVDVGPTLAVRALAESGMAYDLYLVDMDARSRLEELDIPVTGTMDDLLGQVDIVLDATPGGIGAKNKQLYEAAGVKAVFQGGEKNEIADVFFHGYANYEKGLGQNFLKLTSCNTTGLIRSVDAIDREVGVEKVAITIVRRVADPADTFRGLTNVLKVDKVPNHQAVDLMTVMPHIDATGFLVHTPVTHGHVISVVATPKKSIDPESLIELYRAHPRIRVFRIEDGFDSNAALFKYARDLGNKRADMYEVGFWEECVGMSGNDILYAINIPQEAVTIPESIDAIRAAMEMQTDRLEAVARTNQYLGMVPGR